MGTISAGVGGRNNYEAVLLQCMLAKEKGRDGGGTKGGDSAVPSMSSQGGSTSHAKCKSDSIDRFDAFVVAVPGSEAKGVKFADLPGTVLGSPKVYEQFTAHLANSRIPEKHRNGGMFYGIGTILNTMGNVMNNAKDRYGTTTEYRVFFQCLDVNGTSEGAMWWKGLKQTVTRKCFKRAMEGQTKTDFSAVPLYGKDIELIVEIYAHVGTLESAKRKFAVLDAWLGAGRSAEVAWQRWEQMSYDRHHHMVVSASPQSKTSQFKNIARISAATRYLDFYLQMSDVMILAGPGEFDGEWVHSILGAGSSSYGTVLGNFIKAVQLPGRTGALQRYAPFVKKVCSERRNLPDHVNGASVRPGGINQMLQTMPAEIMCMSSGHELKHESACFEYAKNSPSVMVPGALMLAGHPPPQYGQLGMTSTPPDYRLLDLDPAEFNSFINVLCHVSSGSNVIFLQDAPLRPVLEISISTQIMYVLCDHPNDSVTQSPRSPVVYACVLINPGLNL